MFKHGFKGSYNYIFALFLGFLDVFLDITEQVISIEWYGKDVGSFQIVTQYPQV